MLGVGERDNFRKQYLNIPLHDDNYIQLLDLYPFGVFGIIVHIVILILPASQIWMSAQANSTTVSSCASTQLEGSPANVLQASHSITLPV